MSIAAHVAPYVEVVIILRRSFLARFPKVVDKSQFSGYNNGVSSGEALFDCQREGRYPNAQRSVECPGFQRGGDFAGRLCAQTEAGGASSDARSWHARSRTRRRTTSTGSPCRSRSWSKGSGGESPRGTSRGTARQSACPRRSAACRNAPGSREQNRSIEQATIFLLGCSFCNETLQTQGLFFSP